MKSKEAENLENVHAAIGYMASLLLKSGEPMQAHRITALLKQHAEQTTDWALKIDYDHAVRLIAEKIK